jgi:predicted DNA-binding ribbon-helix-helix protein
LREAKVKSPVRKRPVVVAGRKTSVSMEENFWEALKEIATARKMTRMKLITEIAKGREHQNLSSALRVYALRYYRELKPLGK